MSDEIEVWIRIPRRVYDDARLALSIASDELRSAHNTSVTGALFDHYLRAAQRADAAHGALNAHGRGVAITKDAA